jgi:hypothetical protein
MRRVLAFDSLNNFPGVKQNTVVVELAVNPREQSFPLYVPVIRSTARPVGERLCIPVSEPERLNCPSIAPPFPSCGFQLSDLCPAGAAFNQRLYILGIDLWEGEVGFVRNSVVYAVV